MKSQTIFLAWAPWVPFFILSSSGWPILRIRRVGGICSLAMKPFPGHTLSQKNPPRLCVSTLGTVLRPFYSISEPQLSHAQSHLKPQVMVDREDPQSPRTFFWPGSMCGRLCLLCMLGRYVLYSCLLFGFYLGSEGLSLSCSLSSTSRVLGSGKHVMCSAPLAQALGPGWDSIATVSPMSEHLSSSTTTFSQTHGAVNSFWIGKIPLALSFLQIPTSHRLYNLNLSRP